MGKNKKKPFYPPIRTPQTNNKIWSDIVMRKVAAGELVELFEGVLVMSEKTYSNKIDGSSNDAFNLALCGAFIGARDWGMANDDIKDLAAKTFSVFDDMGEDLGRIQEAVNIVNSFGIDVIKTTKEDSDKNRHIMAQKTAVFYLLEHGVTEIEDILTKCKLHNIDIDYRDACAYRWEFNRNKYYEGMETEMVSRKQEAFELIEAGYQTEAMMEKMQITRSCANYYKCVYRKEKEEESSMAKNKVKAMSMIQNGASKDDLVNELGITEAAAIKFIDQYNEEKNGGEIEIMTENMKRAFELFDKAYSELQVADLLGAGKATVHNYYAEWIRVNKRELTTEEMSSILAGENEAVVILRHKGTLPKEGVESGVKTKAKKHFEANKAGKADERVSETESSKQKEEGKNADQGHGQVISSEVTHKKAATINPAFEAAIRDMEEHGKKVCTEDVEKAFSLPEGTINNVPDETQVFKYEYREMAYGLKKKVKVVEVAEAIEGQFATYTPVNSDTFDIEIDGQIVTINRNYMKVLGQELLAVAEEEI